MTYAIDERRPPRQTIELLHLPDDAFRWDDFMRDMNRMIAASFGETYEEASKGYDAVQRSQAAELAAKYRQAIRDAANPLPPSPLTQAIQGLYKKPCKLHRTCKFWPEREPVGTVFEFAIFDYGGEYLSMSLFRNRAALGHWRRNGGRHVLVIQTGRIQWKRHLLNLTEQPEPVILP